MSIKLNIDESILGDKKEKVVVEVNGNTVGECLDYMVKRRTSLKKAIFQENGNLCFGNYVMVNGEIVVSEALAKPVKDGDEIEIFNYSGGG